MHYIVRVKSQSDPNVAVSLYYLTALQNKSPASGFLIKQIRRKKQQMLKCNGVMKGWLSQCEGTSQHTFNTITL